MAFVENQIGEKIKVFKSDDGGEFKTKRLHYTHYNKMG
jgi:hypothetical protein